MNNPSASYTVVLNESNAVNDSTYTYRFPNNVDFSKVQVALSDISLYYSWRSITSEYSNNKFSFTFPASGTTINTFNITLPDGTYSAADLNNYIQWFCIQNNLYLINSSTGDYRYFLTIQENVAQYAIEFLSYPVPTSLPSGYTAPAGWPGYPTSATRPQIIINNSGFGQIIGFNNGTYPSTAIGTSPFSKISDFTPQLSPVQSVIILLDAVSNPFSTNNGVIGTINSKGTQYGSLISYNAPEYSWSTCSGFRNEVTVQFVDQNFRPLKLIDRNLTIRLLLRFSN